MVDQALRVGSGGMLSFGFSPVGSSGGLHVTFDRTGQSGVIGSSPLGLICLQLMEKLWVGDYKCVSLGYWHFSQGKRLLVWESVGHILIGRVCLTLIHF